MMGLVYGKPPQKHSSSDKVVMNFASEDEVELLLLTNGIRSIRQENGEVIVSIITVT